MQSKYTKNMPKVQGCAIESIYNIEHMPIVKNFGRSEAGSPTVKSKEPTLTVKVDQKPNP